MIAIVQCAASKDPDAGHLLAPDGRPVWFVGRPDIAPPDHGVIYARPDDPAESGKSWRDVLLEYIKTKPDNPQRLLPAWQLYDDAVYARLVEKLGPKNVFILSAGWGLIAAEFLTPCYDITFSNVKRKDRHKRRSKKDRYEDFCMLPDTTQEVFFFGGKEYLPLVARLTSKAKATKTVFYNSKYVPRLPGYELRHFDTRTKTNW
jgi:hypothetical protein